MGEAITIEQLKKEAERAYQSKDYLAAALAFNAAADGSSTLGDGIQAAEMHNNASVAYLQADQPEKALESALDTNQVFAEVGDSRRQAIALGNQAAAYEALGPGIPGFCRIAQGNWRPRTASNGDAVIICCAAAPWAADGCPGHHAGWFGRD